MVCKTEMQVTIWAKFARFLKGLMEHLASGVKCP